MSSSLNAGAIGADLLQTLLGSINESAITQTLEEIISSLFAGQTGGIEGVLLHGIGGQLDAAEGAQGAKQAGRSICKNLDGALETKAGTVDQRLAVAQGLAANTAKAALTYAALVVLYPDLQAAVVRAKQGNDRAALQAARKARDAAAGNLKTAMGDLVRASAGAVTEAEGPQA